MRLLRRRAVHGRARRPRRYEATLTKTPAPAARLAARLTAPPSGRARPSCGSCRATTRTTRSPWELSSA
eukprot:529356-Heterocapsa_arctica.AAC.1